MKILKNIFQILYIFLGTEHTLWLACVAFIDHAQSLKSKERQFKLIT